MNSPLTIRKALLPDVEAIFQLLEMYAGRGVVLRRSREDITFYLRNFFVAEIGGRVIGCCAARSFGEGLWEVRSQVVHPDYQGQGVGKKLLQSIVEDLESRFPGAWKLFTLTKEPDFFRKSGFRLVSKEMFPEKIWSDCSKCPKFDRCDEVALYREAEPRP